MTPEPKARALIDRKLEAAGWAVQDMRELNLGAARGVAVREYPTDTGPADYLLFVDREPVGVIEAKRDEVGQNLSAHEAQTERYANATLKRRKGDSPLRFLYEGPGQIIFFTDGADPAPRPRGLPLLPTGHAGAVGRGARHPALPDTLIRLRLVNAMVAPAWVGRAWDSQSTRLHFESRARTSAGIYKISQPDIVSVVVPVPPLDEQTKILALLTDHDGSLQTMEMEISAGLAQAAAQRRNILKAAFPGQLVPQDTAHEPASVLLERIRAVRAAQGTTTRKRGRKARESA